MHNNKKKTNLYPFERRICSLKLWWIPSNGYIGMKAAGTIWLVCTELEIGNTRPVFSLSIPFGRVAAAFLTRASSF